MDLVRRAEEAAERRAALLAPGDEGADGPSAAAGGAECSVVRVVVGDWAGLRSGHSGLRAR